MKKTDVIILIGILILAASLRFIGLHSSPPSLYWEEAAIGYDAYSILKTGKDYHGNPFPIIAFPSFGDYKPSLYFYAAAPSIFIFGLTEFAVRFPSALSGVLAVWLLYAITKQLKLKHPIPLLSTLLLAISPWHLQFSRAGFEVNLATTAFLLGIFLFLKSRQNRYLLTVSAIAFAASMFAYHGMRLISPFIAASLYLYYRKNFPLRFVFPAVVTAIILTSPIILNLKNPVVSQRFAETSHFSQSSAVPVVNQLRAQAGNTPLARIIYHRYWWWGKELISNYTSHLSPNFLFLSGDSNPRHSTQEFGHLYHWEILTLLAAVYFVVRRKDKKLIPIFIWLAIVPIPAMLTKATPHALRTLPAAPALAILSAYGLVALYSTLPLPKKALKLIFTASIAFELIAFIHLYSLHYPREQAKDWQYGYKQAVEYTESVKDNYDTIYFTREYGRPSIYVLFFGQYNPSQVQAIEPQLKKDQQELLELGTYTFGQPDPNALDSLVVTTPQHSGDHVIIKTIYFPDGEPAFIFYET